MLLELLVATVHGEAWGRRPIETFRTTGTLETLFTAGDLSRHDLYSALGMLAACESELKGADLGWWQIHKPYVLGAFNHHNVHASTFPAAHLVAAIGTGDWAEIEALTDWGLPLQRVSDALAEFETESGIRPHPKWNRLSIRTG